MGFEPFVELLAPAGNIKAFIGAVHAGADALYLGGSRFGARAYAENFTEDEIVWCIRYAHLFGRKVYLTVNTLVKEAEFNDIFDFIRPFYEAGLDGVIVQDIGVLGFIRDNFPELKLHASTQMSITGVYGAMLVKKLGVSRVVPARELSLREIMLIRDKTGLEIESFIHGAMCYCYSGQCLFSSILGARSGNRGRCAQPCRLPYEVTLGDRKSKACYPLSLKDMCMLEKLPDLIEAGISSFKIEGRMKKPEYAAGVTAIYRKYIDMYLADRAAYKSHTKKWNVTSDDLESLSKIYIRSGMQSGYYYKHNGRDMVTLESPSYNGGDKALLDGIREKYIDNNIKYDIDIKAHFVKGEQAAVVFSCKDSSVAVY
ncbi:MAG: U32 family peptidase [Lachnospiraceae bacterium]|nr:U32 family peptidase [Lachnospiraceae bacterium]